MSWCCRIAVEISLCVALGLAGACGGCSRSNHSGDAPSKEALPANNQQAKVNDPTESSGVTAVTTEATNQGAAGRSLASTGKSVQVSAAAPVVIPVEPATLAEATMVLNLAALATMPGAEQITLLPCSLSYKAPGATVAEGAAFLREQLTALGWTELPEPEATAANKNDFSQFTLTKDGFQVVAGAFKYAESPLSVSIMNRGNVHAATLPVYPGAKSRHVGFSMTWYEVGTSHDQLVAFVRREMAARGWRAYREPLELSLAEKFAERVAAGQHSLSFMKNGATVSVSVNKSEKTPDHATLQYNIDMKGHELPYPDDATDIVFEDQHPLLVCLTSTTPDALLEFYRREMGQLGYQALTVDEVSENRIEFTKKGQATLRLGLAVASDELTYVVLARASEDVSGLLSALKTGGSTTQP